MAIELCPWLGTKQDRTMRHAEAVEGQVCYACRPPAEVDVPHQFWYCLSDRHQTCIHYRIYYRPQYAPPPVFEPMPIEAVEDEVGPPSESRFLGGLAPLLWGAIVVLAAVALYVYGSSIFGWSLAPSLAIVASPATSVTLSPSPTPTFSPTPTSSPSPTAAAVGVAAAAPVLEFEEPTGTPTPYPGGAVYGLSPQAGAAGWVASDEARGNHFGDSYLYTGVYDGVSYHGAFQFDLSTVPRGATIHAAVLEISGLDARRLGISGAWEVRVLSREADAGWSRQTYQDLHNAPVQWTLAPALSASDLAVGQTNVFELSQEQTRDLEERLLKEHYTVSFRLDGPLAGENTLFAWDTGFGPSSKGHGPRLLLNVGAAPQTPIPTGSPPPTSTPMPTNTPEWFVVTSTPTPQNAMTAAAVALQATAWATTTGTPTPLPQYVATATPLYVVVTRTPTPGNYSTAIAVRGEATAHVILTGTPTPTPHNLATATFTPGPTRTPVYVWLDQLRVTATPAPTGIPSVPAVLRNKILFLSDRDGKEGVYMLDPTSGRVAMLTARWPYDLAKAAETTSPNRQSFAYVQNNNRGVPQIYTYSREYNASRQVSFNTGTSYDPAWSPRGGQIAFVSTENGNDDIYVVGTDGEGQVRLTVNDWEWDKHPSWSPDGRQIVFFSNQGSGRKQLWIMNADGTGRRLLLDSHYNDWDPVWVK